MGNIACGEDCSTAFSAAFLVNMQRNVESGVDIENIQADSSAKLQKRAMAPSPADVQTEPDDQLVPGFDDWMVYAAGGLVVILVLIVVVMMVRCRRQRVNTRMKLDE